MPDYFTKYAHAYSSIRANLPSYARLMEAHAEALIGFQRILESCSGPGLLASRLSQEHEVHAVERNPIFLGISEAANEGTAHDPEFYRADASRLPFRDGSFDGVSSMLALPFFADALDYLQEQRRVLRPGGILVVSGPDAAARCSMDSIMGQWKAEQAKSGALDSLSEDWKLYEQYVRNNVNGQASNWFKAQEVVYLFCEAGFKGISSSPNPLYYGNGYVVKGLR